jgi:hypothetical protein
MFFTGVNFTVQTRLGGTFTQKALFSAGLSTSPLAQTWFYMGLRYDHSTDTVYGRIKELGASHTEDPGWKSASVNSPTFPQGTEWTKSTVTAKSNTSAYCGVAQTRFCDALVDGYGYGANETRTYLDEVS